MSSRGFFDDYPEFLRTSETSVHPARLNRRHEALIVRNRDLIEGKVVLDLACHDGRWSFAALKAGAKRVIGVEARPHLVENARKTFEGRGIPQGSYRFIGADLFEAFDGDIGPIDTVFCFGIFYHVIRHVELMTRIRETGAAAVIVDTNVCRDERPVLLLRREDTRVEGAANPDEDTLQHWKVTGLPSESAVRLMLNHAGFAAERIDWSGIAGADDEQVAAYRLGDRVTLRAVRGDGHALAFTFPGAAAGELGTLIRSDGRTDILDLPVPEVLRAFRGMNLLLFRGFGMDLDRFRKLTERLTTGFVSYAGGAAARALVDGDPTMMTVSEPTHHYPVPLHGEMYYVENKPQILWFYCVKPVAEGGATTVGDGCWILENLKDSTRRLFEENRIKYVMIHPEGRWQKIFLTESLDDVRRHCEENRYTMRVDEKDGSIVTEYLSSAIWPTNHGNQRSFINNVFAITRWEQAGVPFRKVRLEDGRPIPEAVLEELWEVEGRATRDVAWEPGDVLMVDNSRFLHGRREFKDLSREIYVRLATGLVS